MNRFEEARDLNKLNGKLESMAFESSIDYRPSDDNLEPSEYVKYGHLKGSQEILEILLENKIINIYQLKKLFDI